MPQISKASRTSVINSNTIAVRDGLEGTGNELICLTAKQKACQRRFGWRKKPHIAIVGIVEMI
jgi:hypothetical protein